MQGICMPDFEEPLDWAQLDDARKLREFSQIQKAHWNNVRAILRAVDSLFAIMESEDDPPKKEVLRIAQDLVRDLKIKWQEE